MKKKKKWVILLLALFLSVFAILEVQIITHKDSYIPQKSDCLIILGHSLIDGITPDTFLTSRLEKGLDLYQKGYCNKIITSGGQGPTDKLPVAQAMKNWLIENGVPQEDVLTEGESSNTYENIKFSKKIADKEHLQSVIIVTSDFHIYRSMLTAKLFFSEATGAAAPSSLSLKTVVWFFREPFSLIKFYLTA